MNHRIGRAIFAAVFGLFVAWWSYQWITDPSGRTERATQERVVNAARTELALATGINAPEFVDPLSPNRQVGKVFVFRNGEFWEVSGYYRRDDGDRWHPWLMLLNDDLQRRSLKMQDSRLLDRAALDPMLEVSP